MLDALSPSMKAVVKGRVKRPPQKEFKESGSSAIVATKSTKKGSYTESSKNGSDQKNLNRKRAAGKEEASQTAELGEELVGCRIRVQWVENRPFYEEGVVESFIPDKKKHKILFTDGDVEILDMKTIIWEFTKDDEKPLKDAKKIKVQEKPPLVTDRVKPPPKKEFVTTIWEFTKDDEKPFKASLSDSENPEASSKRNDDGITIGSDTKTTLGEKAESKSEEQDAKKVKAQEKTPLVKDRVKSPPKKEFKASEAAEPGEELVGCRIKVWWPNDIKFYEGVVVSFIPDKKMHKILYTDGDVEVLNMKTEIWEFNKDDEKPLKASLSDGENPEASSESFRYPLPFAC